jgi:hypothetical protein
MQYYQDLYKCLGTKLSRYPHFSQVKYKELIELSSCMSTWYHEKGGLLFSQNSRSMYDTIQWKIQWIVGDKEESEEIVAENIIRDIADNEARELRAALAKDVGTRRTTRLEEFFRRLKKFLRRLTKFLSGKPHEK